MRELTWQERQFVVFVLSGIPALIIGFIFGVWCAGIGGLRLDLGTVLLRGTCCSLVPVLLTWLLPRWWIPPALIYAVGFGLGFRFVGGLASFPKFFMAPFLWMQGERIVAPPPPSHPDLPWILGMAFWLAGMASILKRRMENKRAAVSGR